MDGAPLIEQRNFASCALVRARLYALLPRVTNGFSSAVPVARGLTVTQMCKGRCVCATHVQMILTSRCGGGMYEESMVYP